MFVCPACGQRYERGGYCAADGQTLARTDDPLLGSEIERYRLAKVLGEGGMGRVYLAVQPAIGSRVAIKVLSDECARSAELLDRFFAEARAVNLIRHEHIISVLDLAVLPDGRPFIVMEFIEGQTLASIVRSTVAPLGGVVQVMGEVLSGLAAAHAIGIVHRDLKPDNVLITIEGHAKVLDFGIAKLAPGLRDVSPKTRTGALLGTPAYMAPEQISGAEQVDARTDIYAAGVVLFEAVTGTQPFSGQTIFDLMRAHVDLPPPSPRGLRPDLPESIEQVILTALAKLPEERFQSATAMAQALSHAATALAPDQWRPLSSRSGAATPRISASGLSVQPTPRVTPATRPDRPTDDALRSTAVAPGGKTEARVKRMGVYVAALVTAAVAVGITLFALARSGSSEETPVVASAGSVAKSAPIPSTGPVASPPPVVNPPPVVDAASSEDVPDAPSRQVAHDRTKHVPPPPVAAPPLDAGGPVIVGGGSAIDHGVVIGKNVQIGNNVIIGGNSPSPPPPTPTHFTKPASYDAKHFDAKAFAPTALALAQRIYPDARFTRFDMAFVFPDGHVDLTMDDSEGTYYFRSPSHSQRPDGVPANIETKIACYVEVSVKPHEIEVRARDLQPIDTTCKWPLRDLPRCDLAGVWKQARGVGAAPDTVAKIDFLSDGKWFFDNEGNNSGFVNSFADRCP